MALVSGICQNALESCAGEPLDVGQDGFERMAVIRFTRQCPGMNGELTGLAPVLCCGDGDLDAELIGLVGLALTETLIDARSIWLTPNTTTPYIHVEMDVKNGPVVFEVGTPVIGIVDNAYFLYVGDVGLGGPDKGKGGKYLLVGEDYKGEIPEGYFVLRTNTYRHWLLIRAVGKPGEPLKDTLDAFKAGFKAGSSRLSSRQSKAWTASTSRRSRP